MNEELDIKEILKHIYQRRNILFYILLVVFIIGIIYTFVIKTPIYQVDAQILIDKADPSIEAFLISKDILKNEEIEAKFNKTSRMIIITTKMKNKEEAFEITKQYIEELQPKLEETYNVTDFKIIESPQLPQKASNATYIKDIGIALVAGVILYGIYVMISLNMKGVTNAIEIEQDLKLNVLGNVTLDNKKEKDTYITSKENIIQQFKRIQANIELSKENKRPKVILLTGTKKGVGTSYITNNLAVQYAKLYDNILIIDTDMIQKTLTYYYKQENQTGLTDLLQANEIETIQNQAQKIEIENTMLLANGKANIGEELFLKETISKQLEKVKEQYDIILIDTVSINEYVFPISLSAIADATLIVVESEKTKQEEILKATSTIQKVGGKIAGIVLNKIK